MRKTELSFNYTGIKSGWKLLIMEVIFLFWVFLVGGFWETEALTGVLGKDITITCSHVNAFSNVKYFCKDPCKNENVLISSINKKEDSNGKYSIRDEGNTFNVTISRLTEEDSGTYWCGIDRIGVDTYTKVVLTVMQVDVKDPDNDVSQSDSDKGINTNASSTKKWLHISAGLGVAVLTLLVVLLIFFRYLKRVINTSFDTVHTTPSTQKQDAQHMATSFSTEEKETDGQTNSIISSLDIQPSDTSRDHTDNVYTNVTTSPDSQIQPDDLFYSAVCFNQHTDCGTVTPGTPGTEVVAYSSIRHISADETTIYCNV